MLFQFFNKYKNYFSVIFQLVHGFGVYSEGGVIWQGREPMLRIRSGGGLLLRPPLLLLLLLLFGYFLSPCPFNSKYKTFKKLE